VGKATTSRKGHPERIDDVFRRAFPGSGKKLGGVLTPRRQEPRKSKRTYREKKRLRIQAWWGGLFTSQVRRMVVPKSKKKGRKRIRGKRGPDQRRKSRMTAVAKSGSLLAEWGVVWRERKKKSQKRGGTTPSAGNKDTQASRSGATESETLKQTPPPRSSSSSKGPGTNVAQKEK